jgi:hypothetical protein
MNCWRRELTILQTILIIESPVMINKLLVTNNKSMVNHVRMMNYEEKMDYWRGRILNWKEMLLITAQSSNKQMNWLENLQSTKINLLCWACRLKDWMRDCELNRVKHCNGKIDLNKFLCKGMNWMWRLMNYKRNSTIRMKSMENWLIMNRRLQC